MAETIVLRVGHRKERDIRTTTHCALAARALGADKIIVFGEKDKGIEKSVKGVTKKWGGKFRIEFRSNWKKTLRELKAKKYAIVHLTMYGMPVKKRIKEIRKSKKIAVAIGAEKMPREMYEKADYNIAVTNQPHSETAALAIFLYEFFGSKEGKNKFERAKIKIFPQERGKKVKKRK